MASAAALFFAISISLASFSSARPLDASRPSGLVATQRSRRPLKDVISEHVEEGRRNPGEIKGAAETVQVAGSSLPDCSHACGSCSPCHLVMVSFVCASLEDPETCPMAYKCTCNSKSYPVP